MTSHNGLAFHQALGGIKAVEDARLHGGFPERVNSLCAGSNVLLCSFLRTPPSLSPVCGALCFYSKLISVLKVVAAVSSDGVLYVLCPESHYPCFSGTGSAAALPYEELAFQVSFSQATKVILRHAATLGTTQESPFMPLSFSAVVVYSCQVRKVACGEKHMVAVSEEGTVLCWGKRVNEAVKTLELHDEQQLVPFHAYWCACV